MNIVALVLPILIQYGPDAYRAAIELFHKADPTKEDFLGLLDFATQKNYDTYIAEARARVGLAPLVATGPVAVKP